MNPVQRAAHRIERFPRQTDNPMLWEVHASSAEGDLTTFHLPPFSCPRLGHFTRWDELAALS